MNFLRGEIRWSSKYSLGSIGSKSFLCLHRRSLNKASSCFVSNQHATSSSSVDRGSIERSWVLLSAHTHTDLRYHTKKRGVFSIQTNANLYASSTSDIAHDYLYLPVSGYSLVVPYNYPPPHSPLKKPRSQEFGMASPPLLQTNLWPDTL